MKLRKCVPIPLNLSPNIHHSSPHYHNSSTGNSHHNSTSTTPNGDLHHHSISPPSPTIVDSLHHTSNYTWPLKSPPKSGNHNSHHFSYTSSPRTPNKPLANSHHLNHHHLSVNLSSRDGPPLSFGNDQVEPVEILPYLYLGSEYHASSKLMLKNLGITALLNVSNCPNYFEDCFEYKAIPVEDSGSEDISIYFNSAIDFIDSVKAANGKVLIHCHAGISRSATICMAYLMATKRLRMEEAYEFVRSRRKIISPNFNFMGQLLGFENEVFSPSASPSPSQSPSPSPSDMTNIAN